MGSEIASVGTPVPTISICADAAGNAAILRSMSTRPPSSGSRLPTPAGISLYSNMYYEPFVFIAPALVRPEVYDITRDSMNSKQLAKIKRELEAIKLSPQGRKAEDLTSMAGRLGRSISNRGKEPTYIRSGLPCLTPPLSIPNHSGDMKTGTVRSIVSQLLDDCDEWDLHLQMMTTQDESAAGGIRPKLGLDRDF